MAGSAVGKVGRKATGLGCQTQRSEPHPLKWQQKRSGEGLCLHDPFFFLCFFFVPGDRWYDLSLRRGLPMARSVIELPEVYEAIARPVVYAITRQLGAIMHLPQIAEILFPGTNDESVQPDSTLNYHGAPAKLPAGSRITVEMHETSDEANVSTENAAQENLPVCFLDRSLGVRLRPVFETMEMTLTLSVRVRGRVPAEKLCDEFRIRAANSRQQLLHVAQYSYAIPAEHLEILQQVHAMREAVAGYGTDFDTWMQEMSQHGPRLGKLYNINKTAMLYAYTEKQTRIQGVFDFRVSPARPDKADEDGQYTFQMDYRVRYDKPVAMSMDY